MSAYRHALVIDESASVARLNLATELLANGESVVVLDGVVALRGADREILCEVLDPMPSVRRHSKDYRNMVENAERGLKQSSLVRHLPNKPLRWIVVEDYGTGTVQRWPAD